MKQLLIILLSGISITVQSQNLQIAQKTKNGIVYNYSKEKLIEATKTANNSISIDRIAYKDVHITNTTIPFLVFEKETFDTYSEKMYIPLIETANGYELEESWSPKYYPDKYTVYSGMFSVIFYDKLTQK